MYTMSVSSIITLWPAFGPPTRTSSPYSLARYDLYSTREWQRLIARVLHARRGEHGHWCPGYQRPAHAAADLTNVPARSGTSPMAATM